jgi:hypothetical protein
VVAGALITGAPIMPPLPQESQPQPAAGASPQGAHSLCRPKQPPKPPHGFPIPQQPNDTLVKAARVVKISSLFMAELSSAKQKSKTRRFFGSRNSTTRLVMCNRNAQEFFSQPECLFATHPAQYVVWFSYANLFSSLVGPRAQSTVHATFADFAVYATSTH